MKKYIFCLVFLFQIIPTLGQTTSSIEADLDQASKVFKQNLKPYIKNFAEAQFPPSLENNIRTVRVQMLEELYFKKAEYSSRELIKTALQDAHQIKPESTYSLFEQLYRYEFPGLDYVFFEKVKKELKL